MDRAGVSICDLAVTHIGKELLRLMTLSAYFDGSGKSHDPRAKTVVLAGYIGTVEAWGRFEDRWEAFKKESAIEYFHSSEVNAGRGAFEGYNRYQLGLLRAGLTRLLRDFSKTEFSAIVHAVSMTSYRALKLRLPSPEALCGDGCLSDLCNLVPSQHTLQLFYDRGESFFTALQNNWRNAKKRKLDPRLDRLNIFSEVDDWRLYGAMQAADYLACCISKGNTESVWPLRLAMLKSGLPLYGKYYDTKELRSLAVS